MNKFTLFAGKAGTLPAIATGGVMDIASGIGALTNFNHLTAVKLLPKGFRVPTGVNGFCLCGGTGFPASTACRFYECNIDGSGIPTTLSALITQHSEILLQ